MGKGYADGPAVEEAEQRLEAVERGREPAPAKERAGVYGSTEDEPERHFIGWLGDVDPDELFATGQAWGLQVIRKRP